ncbi:hypothetical protein T03_11015 [Trichinella britovi]|uniref:Uncharacterized protein n=1 Tax=Trichinella britovi TaxID=45882 RepID=A0A0V1C6B5_TRIBR|nr:hypothetical protein T03_11015 [Trichinella britovi]
MLTLLASRIRRYLSKATILYKIVCNYDEIIKEFLAIFLNTSLSNHAALNQVLTHKFFGISQEIRNHGWSGLIVFCRVSPKELVFKLEGTNGILHQNCIPICSFWPILI